MVVFSEMPFDEMKWQKLGSHDVAKLKDQFENLIIMISLLISPV